MAMEILASRTFSVCLLFLLLMLTGGKGQQSQCEDRWFGDKCQYQCHCLNNAICDKTTGECPDSCDVRWFGPQCQYRDAAYTTDGDDHTCLSPNGGLSQNFNMSEDVMFTWMRFVTKIPISTGLFDHVNITFLSRSGIVVAPKSSLTVIYLSDTIFEIYGELQDRFKTIRLDFDSAGTKQSFCSMQVSSGRNVAIKQHTSQSSDDNRYASYTAEKAVDGRSNQWFDNGSCTLTDYEDSSYWTLNASLPVTVNMYTLLSTIDKWGICKLRYFRLETYFETHKVQQYDETDPVNKARYDVYSVNASSITSVTLTVSKDRWPNSSYNCDSGNASLSFCEMQIFGDVVCDPGIWGRDCEKECNCENSTDSCFVSTGMCPSGCKAGFHGPGCKEECSDGQWGVDCLDYCDKCLAGQCNKSSGECLSGCIQGYKMPYCVEECDAGFHGYNCNQTCPENCLNNTCNNVNGTCTKCVSGYQGPMCNKECDSTFYGQDCATPCSDMCVNNTCHHITGVCDNCPDGKQISMNCSEDCSPGFFGPRCANQCGEDGFCNNINGIWFEVKTVFHKNYYEVNLVSIIVPIVLVLFGVAALIIGILFWRRRKSQQDGKEAVAEDGTISGSKGAQGHGDHRELWNLPSNRQDPVNDNHDQISLHSNENPPDSNENENMRTDKNEENVANNEYDQTSPYVNVDNPSMHEYEKMRTSVNEENPSMNEYENMRSVNEENPSMNEYEKMRTSMNVENPSMNEYENMRTSMNVENPSMNEYENMRSSMNEEIPGVNVYEKISPCTNVDNSFVNKFDDVGANIREMKTYANISETKANVYSEPEPGF